MQTVKRGHQSPHTVAATVTAALALALALALTFAVQTNAEGFHYGNNSPHKGAGRRLRMDSLQALTFNAGEWTAARRTDPVPQLTCLGNQCSRYEPPVVACQSLGDGQWKCEADLPYSVRMGKVEVSCEGWDSSSDPWIYKGE